LTIDPLLWAAYEELCILGEHNPFSAYFTDMLWFSYTCLSAQLSGAAEEATAVFGETAALSIQKQYMQQLSTSLGLNTYNEERNSTSTKNTSSEDYSPRQSKHTQSHGLKDISGNFHSHGVNGGVSNMSFYNTPSPVAAQLSGIAPPPLFRNFQPAVANPNSLITDSSPKSTVNSTLQAPRRKFVDEGKLRKISGRLFSDSGPRRSSRLSADSGANINSSVATVSGNVNNASKYLGGSKLSSLALRSVTLRKGHSWANENMDEGVRGEPFDDSRPNTASTTGSMASNDQEDETMSIGGIAMSSQTITIGVSEILNLLRTLGEGCRLSYMYRCQEALDTYMKLPHKHYNTGWVLSQVTSDSFSFRLPYMDIA
jgi:anaphase-promoting complex subunit 3